MPKLSDELWATRHRHVLESAFRCFARQGFHATTMDDVIAESGWSSSVVYRYAGGKNELVAASVEESLGRLHAIVDDLLARDPVPTPRQSVQAVVEVLADPGLGYDLAGLVIHTWAEALRAEDVAATARTAYDGARRRLTRLALAWRESGYLDPAVRPADAAAALTLLIPGLVIDRTHHQGPATRGLLRALGALEPR